MKKLTPHILLPATLLAAITVPTVSSAHETDGFHTSHVYSSERHSSNNRHGNYKQGVRQRVERLNEKAERFRHAVVSRHDEHRGYRHQTRKLNHEAARFEKLTGELNYVRRGDRERRYKLLHELGRTANHIDRLVGHRGYGKRVNRRWRAAREELVGLNQVIGYVPRHNGVGSFGFNNGYGSNYAGNGWNDGNGRHENYGSRKPGKSHGRHSNPTAVRGATDIIEDESERTKNSFREHRRRNKGLRSARWSKQLDGELSAFDQAANRLRDQVRRNGQLHRGNNVVRELRSRAARISDLMAGQFVGDTTRHHWKRVRAALTRLTHAIG